MRGQGGRPMKLTNQDRVFSCILYLRESNSIREEAASWKYSRTAVRDDAMSVCGVINEVLASEISWPTAERKAQERNRIPFFSGCIGFVDGNLCRIRRPRTAHHHAYFNGRKKMYCFNSAVVIDHNGLFVFIAPGYGDSYHDVTVLRDTDLGRHWQTYFTVDHNSPYPREYLLGDPGYLGMDHFILRRTDAREGVDLDNNPIYRAFNKLHAGYRVQIECGIGGLKHLFKRFLNTVPNRRNVFSHMFTTAAILTNFVHRRRQDFSVAIVGHNENQDVE